MKTVRIPTNANPFVITINGAIYSYPAGTVQSVPDNIAAIISQYNDSIPQEAEEQGEVGDVWTKTEEGAEWADAPSGIPEIGTSRSKFLYVDHNGVVQWKGVNQVPSGGTEGQVLTKTADGEGWADPQGGGSGNIADLSTEVQAFWSKIATILEAEEDFPPSFYAVEAIALHDAIKTAKLAGKTIVASVSYNPWGITVASDVYDFCFAGYGDNTTVYFRFVDEASFNEIKVKISRSDTTNFSVDVYKDMSYGSEQITIVRSNIFHYNSLPS